MLIISNEILKTFQCRWEDMCDTTSKEIVPLLQTDDFALNFYFPIFVVSYIRNRVPMILFKKSKQYIYLTVGA